MDITGHEADIGRHGIMLIREVITFNLVKRYLDQPTVQMFVGLPTPSTARYHHQLQSLYFVRSGYIGNNVGKLRETSISNYSWSLTATHAIWDNTGRGAYCFSFRNDGVYTSAGPYARWDAFPIRYLISSLPPTLYFVRSGYVHINHGRIWYSGRVGDYWSSAVSARIEDGELIPSSYYFWYSNDGVNPSAGQDERRWYGFPLRGLNSKRFSLDF